MPWPLPSAKIYGHDATMRGFRTELHASGSSAGSVAGGEYCLLAPLLADARADPERHAPRGDQYRQSRRRGSRPNPSSSTVVTGAGSAAE